jgi:hypothetical protein
MTKSDEIVEPGTIMWRLLGGYNALVILIQSNAPRHGTAITIRFYGPHAARDFSMDSKEVPIRADGIAFEEAVPNMDQSLVFNDATEYFLRQPGIISRVLVLSPLAQGINDFDWKKVAKYAPLRHY